MSGKYFVDSDGRLGYYEKDSFSTRGWNLDATGAIPSDAKEISEEDANKMIGEQRAEAISKADKILASYKPAEEVDSMVKEIESIKDIEGVKSYLSAMAKRSIESKVKATKIEESKEASEKSAAKIP